MEIPIVSDFFGNTWKWATSQPWWLWPVVALVIIIVIAICVTIVVVIVIAIVAAVSAVIVAIILAPFGV